MICAQLSNVYNKVMMYRRLDWCLDESTCNILREDAKSDMVILSIWIINIYQLSFFFFGIFEDEA